MKFKFRPITHLNLRLGGGVLLCISYLNGNWLSWRAYGIQLFF